MATHGRGKDKGRRERRGGVKGTLKGEGRSRQGKEEIKTIRFT